MTRSEGPGPGRGRAARARARFEGRRGAVPVAGAARARPHLQRRHRDAGVEVSKVAAVGRGRSARRAVRRKSGHSRHGGRDDERSPRAEARRGGRAGGRGAAAASRRAAAGRRRPPATGASMTREGAARAPQGGPCLVGGPGGLVGRFDRARGPKAASRAVDGAWAVRSGLPRHYRVTDSQGGARGVGGGERKPRVAISAAGVLLGPWGGLLHRVQACSRARDAAAAAENAQEISPVRCIMVPVAGQVSASGCQGGPEAAARFRGVRGCKIDGCRAKRSSHPLRQPEAQRRGSEPPWHQRRCGRGTLHAPGARRRPRPPRTTQGAVLHRKRAMRPAGLPRKGPGACVSRCALEA
jgi:hypothetical protein